MEMPRLMEKYFHEGIQQVKWYGATCGYACENEVVIALYMLHNFIKAT